MTNIEMISLGFSTLAFAMAIQALSCARDAISAARLAVFLAEKVQK